MNDIAKFISEIRRLSEESLSYKTKLHNLKFVNRALHLTCSELNSENLKLKIKNETLQCEIELLKGNKKEDESRK